MITSILIGVALSLSVGAAAKLLLDKAGSDYRITAKEFVIGALVSCLVLVPATSAIGERIAIASNVTYNEYWNGWETDATVDVIECHRDGSCRNEYNCDPYTKTETYTTTVNGKTQTRTRTVTKYHRCPVGTEEATYRVETTLGTHVIARGHYTPNTRPWRAGRSLDGPTEPPAAWTAAKTRLEAGNPGGVTQVHKYENFILASQNTILKKYSGAIDDYRDANLMPSPVKGTTDGFHADKAYFVGTAPQNPAAWQESVARVSAALGTTKQGDLHVVLVNSRKVTDPDEYTNALLAYWQSPEHGKNTASKNTVIVVAGTIDGRTVDWARAGTGMPIGNEALITAIRSDLPGARWTPEALIGVATAKVVAGDVTAKNVTVGGGAITGALWAKAGGFERVCMTCDDEGGVGYEYLKGQIKPTTGQYVVITSIGLLLSLGVWAVFIWTGHSPRSPYTTYRRHHPSPRTYTRTRSHW